MADEGLADDEAMLIANTSPTGVGGQSDAAATGSPAEEAEVAALPPDHPLLQRAQEALRRQLSEQKLRLQEELRERKKALKDAKQKREDVGVELYGFQQHLAKLQLSLERTGEQHTAAGQEREAAEGTLRALRSEVVQEEALVKEEQGRVEALQGELDKLTTALLSIQRYNEEMAGELAVTKRQTHATEGAVQALEKQKREQDFLIDSMQQQLGRLRRQVDLQAAGLEVQRREARAAQDILAQALADMEGVAFEKKQLLSQWRSSLAAMQRRDAALDKLQDTARQQQEQQAAIINEQQGYGRQCVQQQQRNEAAAEVVQKLEGQAQRLAGQVERVRQRQEELKEKHASLQQQLGDKQQQLAATTTESGKLAAQKAALERQQAKLGQEAAQQEQQKLERLGEQTFAEKGAQQTLRQVQAIRSLIQEKEAAAEKLRATLDRMGADVETTQAGNARLAAVLAGLEGALKDKAAGVAGLEAEMKAGHAEVEARTRQLDALNRRYQRLLDSQKDVETGPLEATIVNLQREIAAKVAAGRELQRRWITVQAQLVAVQAENAELAEAVGAMRAQRVVMEQKRARLNGQLEAQQREAKALSKALAGLHSETSRLNGLLAEVAGLKSSLREDNMALEGKLAAELQVLEGRWAALNASIEELRAERAEALAAVVEAEREVTVWEQRVQLEKEMQEAVDPAYGGEELAALRKEVQRLGHAAAELARGQEALVQEMEQAVEKREIIGTRARASQSQRVQDMAAGQARRQVATLQKAVSQAEQEGRAADGRVAALEVEVEAAQAAVAAVGEQCQALQQQEAGVRAEIEVVGREKYKALLATTLKQKEAKRYEEAEAGRYKPAVQPPPPGPPTQQPDKDQGSVASSSGAAPCGAATQAVLAAEAERVRQKQERLRAAVESLAAAPDVAAAAVVPQLERVLAHAAAAAAATATVLSREGRPASSLAGQPSGGGGVCVVSQ